ncbi:MAG: MFS transporter [Alphaproteobacteria bacterium]|nr:MFS transporter [Alphaproteobacteria bacterium]
MIARHTSLRRSANADNTTGPEFMTAEARPMLKNPTALYVVGLFSMGYVDFYIFLMPLYCLSLGMSAGQVGIIVGARSALAVFLSIHIGVLMDRFGTRRVTLFFVWTGICLAPVFPLLPWFWPLLLLQVVNGGALSFAWSGSQTLIAQLAEGDAGYIGRFSFFARIGTALAPTIAGVAWDFGGAWPAYLIGAAWGVVLTVALLRAPEAEVAPREAHPARPAAGFRLRDTLPRLSDYISCFALMAIPAVAATMAIMFLRTATSGVQFSLYIVHLDGIGLTGTAIGILFAAIEIASGFGSLFAGRAMRFGDPQKTMLSGTVLSILFICATPFLGGIFALLFLAQVGRGWLQGVVQPMMFSVQAKAVGRYRQGSVVGLRQTMNRLAAIIIPPIMGAIADWWGATESFVVLGVFLLIACAPIVRITRRAAATAAVQEAPELT